MTCMGSQNKILEQNPGDYSYGASCYNKSMKVWESGRETELLDDIIAGRKTIEGRLNKGKFAEYAVGDIVGLRRDYRDESGLLHDGERNAVHVKVVAIRKYKTFLDMTKTENYKQIIPSATNALTAARVYEKYYSADDQRKYGVLAVEIAVLTD